MPPTLRRDNGAPIHRLTLGALGLLMLAVAGLCILPFFLDQAAQDRTYAEESSIIEQATLVLWGALTMEVLIMYRRRPVSALLGAIACLAGAAREASWHDRFTSDSMLKLSYYLDASDPWPTMLLAGAAATLTVISLLWIAGVVFQEARRTGMRAAWPQLALLTVALVVLTKVLDRTPALLEDVVGIDLASRVRAMAEACEEGLELLLPILIMTVVVFARTPWRGNDCLGSS